MKKSIAIFIFAVCLVAGFTTAVSAQGRSTKEVVIGRMINYDHPSGWFSMSVPENWKIKDNSDDDEVIVGITDPTQNAVVVISVWESSTRMSQEDLTDYLSNFLDNRLGTFKNFKQGEPEVQGDGSVGIFFRYDSEVSGGSFPMVGNSFIEQRGKRIALLSVILPKEQYDRKVTPLTKFINSLSLN